MIKVLLIGALLMTTGCSTVTYRQDNDNWYKSMHITEYKVFDYTVFTSFEERLNK